MSKNKTNYGGFNDIADLVDDDERPIKSSRDDLYKEHELLQFLELEENRLKKIDSLFTRKYDNLISTPQAQEVYDTLCASVDRKKNSLIDKLVPTDSAINQELAQMWRSMFDIG